MANLVLFTNCSMETTDYCCKYLRLFTWATLVYSQVAQWIFSKLLKLDGKCRLIISQCAQFQEIGAGPSSLPQPNIQPELPLDKDCKLELWINIRYGSTVRAPSLQDSFLEILWRGTNNPIHVKHSYVIL